MKLKRIPFMILITALLILSVFLFRPKTKIDMTHKQYGTFVNSSSRRLTHYSLKTDSDELNKLIEQHEIKSNESVTKLDYESKVLQERFPKITFTQKDKDDELISESSIIFNLDTNKEATISDFFTPQAIRYLTRMNQLEMKTEDNYNEAIKKADITQQTFDIIEEGIILNNKEYSLSDISDYMNPDKHYPNTTLNVPTHKKLIAFTFDDGPHATNTQKAMDILEKYDGQGTFFIMGPRATTYPDIVKETMDRNHQIASHTYNHKNLTKLSDEELNYEIFETERAIQAITHNEEPLMIRPPYGAINQDIMSKIPRTFVNWNIDSNDWTREAPEVICDTLVSTSKENGIALMHDLYDTTIEAFACAAEKLNAEGYQFVSVETLLKSQGIAIEPGNTYYHGN